MARLNRVKASRRLRGRGSGGMEWRGGAKHDHRESMRNRRNRAASVTGSWVARSLSPAVTERCLPVPEDARGSSENLGRLASGPPDGPARLVGVLCLARFRFGAGVRQGLKQGAECERTKRAKTLEVGAHGDEE